MATAERRMSGSLDVCVSSSGGANSISTATMAAAAGFHQTCVMAMISASGAIVAGVRATLTYTKNGVANTIGIQLPNAAIGPIILNFGSHQVEADDNTAIVLTIPALGAGVSSEATLLGFAAAI